MLPAEWAAAVHAAAAVRTQSKGAEKPLVGPSVAVHAQGAAVHLRQVPIVGEQPHDVVEGGGLHLWGGWEVWGGVVKIALDISEWPWPWPGVKVF